MNDLKNARDLEAARQENERAEKGPKTLKGVKTRLYDKIKARVSLKTMNLIIYVIVALILIALIVGIVTGKR